MCAGLKFERDAQMHKETSFISRILRGAALALIPISYLSLTYAGWWTPPVGSALILLLARLAWPKQWTKVVGLNIPRNQIGISLTVLCVVAIASSGIIAAIASSEGIAFTPVWESKTWGLSLFHTVGQTLNEEIVLGALLLGAVKNRLKAIHPLVISATVALAFSLLHYAFYGLRPPGLPNAGVLSTAALASLFAIGVVRNNCILSTGNVGYAWAIHMGWNAIFMNGTYTWPGSDISLAEPAMFDAILGNGYMVAISTALMALSLLLFAKKRAPAS